MSEHIKVGSNNKIYTNYYARGSGSYTIKSDFGNYGNGLGWFSFGVALPGYYEGLVKANSYQDFGEKVGDFGGKTIGGMAGAEAGAAWGAAIGLWFGGAGALPGAIIGGIVGGLGGSFIGGSAGKWAGGKIGGHYDPNPECDQPQSPFPTNWPGSFEFSPGPNNIPFKDGIVYV